MLGIAVNLVKSSILRNVIYDVNSDSREVIIIEIGQLRGFLGGRIIDHSHSYIFFNFY